MTGNPIEPPTAFMVVGDDGLPRGFVDLDKLQDAATILMYRYAAAAGDDDAIDAVSIDWIEDVDTDAAGYITAMALPMMAKNIIAPMLEVLGTMSPELAASLRSKFAECRDYAQATLGGGA
ncbi:hypothetical protein [Nocardia anaemiae]|uniref:hypothetical protein n=1 Tax=Nocardia anaemiae TaxID=263910 RepID=UPI0007A4724E|nr:hypothetical protein [Nocardia anaemiae]